LAGFARRQLGVVPRSDLIGVGIGARQIENLLRAGRLERVFHSVYRIAGVPTSWEQQLLAACWAGGVRGAAVSHRASCGLWRLPGREAILEVTHPRWRRSQRESVISHESRHFDPIDVTVLHGSIPVTRAARTFLDCCSLVERGLLEEKVAEQILEEAIRRNLSDVAFVGLRWERLGGERRLGGRVARTIIDRWLPMTAKVDSRAESALLHILEENGFSAPVPQHRVWFGPDECVDLDLAWPERRVGIEFDSYRYHGGRLKHDADARRLLRLGSRAWTVLRVTDAELDAGCPHLIAALTRTLRVSA
jgi:hypothetical protein